MRLLVDSDAFCKLALAGLFSDAVALFDAETSECGRLPALPFMLKRGGLPRTYGALECQRLIPVAEAMPAVTEAPGPWIDRLAPIADIDPGEAILFSIAAQESMPVISGDVRALKALRNVDGFPEALEGRMALLEAILLALCWRLGPEQMMRRVEPVRESDALLRVCFSPVNRSPEEGLASYFRARQTELAPLVLWDPFTEGKP